MTAILIATTLALILTSTALAHPRVTGITPDGTNYPTSREALRWHAPAWWLKQAACIHKHESAGLGWHLAYRDWRGAPSPYSGGLQFLRSTWERAGGTGHAYQWSPREQQYRAFVIWDKQDGVLGNLRGDWSEWGTAGKCGLR